MSASPKIIPELAAIRPDEEFDCARLTEYLRGKLPEAESPLQVLQFPGGHSNLTYLLRFGPTEYVLRRPPLGPTAPKAHDMGREYAVLSRLHEVYPLAPRAYVFCDDSSVIGAPFCVLERRSGIVVRNLWPPDLPQDESLRRRISASLVDALAELHKVDYKAIGLGDFGRPEGFLERQIRGWAGRWERAKIEDLPILDELVASMLESVPVSEKTSLVHNDFKLDNAMLDREDPGRLTAIFDWEMATVGDPLVDLGTTLSYWSDADDATRSRQITPGLWPGFYSKAEVLERYTKQTGFDTSAAGYYEAFALFKMAVVLQQIYIRYHRGQTKDERFARLGDQIEPLIERAREVFDRSMD